MLPSAHLNPQPKRHLYRFSHFAQLTAVSSGMLGHVLPLKIAHSRRGNWTPSNTWFFEPIEPTQAHNSNGSSIGSAVCEQLTAVSSGMPVHVLSPKNCPFAWESGPHLIHASLGAPESITQTASWSVQLLLHSSRQTVLIYFTIGHPFPPKLPL